MASPLEHSQQASRLNALYLKPEILQDVLPRLSQSEREQVLYLWIFEGIPYAFRDAPMLYGSLRRWISWKLQVPEHEVLLVGSARTGFSFGEFGRAFNNHSDFDFAIVSESWFLRLRDEFDLWKADFQSDRIKPNSPAEISHWPDNFKIIPNNIRRGFITADLIPNRHRYPDKQFLANAMSSLQRRLAQTEGAPIVRRASLRIYRDWPSLLRQSKVNLDDIARQLFISSLRGS